MLIRTNSELKYSEVTPKAAYLSRRGFLQTAAGLGAVGAIGGGSALAAPISGLQKSSLSISDKPNTWEDVTTYNNYYEFGTKKDQPHELAKNFKTNPWTVTVGGAVKKPQQFSVDDLRRLAPMEERVYRFRCVEAWSAIIPWAGYSLSHLLNKVEPTPAAKYVAFETYYDPAQMPEAVHAGIQLPYREGLRLDEAMHPLALLTFGMYGQDLPPQDGAPVRMILPWKYGFKSVKSLVKITLVEQEPPTAWKLRRSNEYGFYANVNPSVDHPRWSQATERRLGEFLRKPTLMFNGYADQVAGLYKGMDLRQNY